jgi:hypothetical protein
VLFAICQKRRQILFVLAEKGCKFCPRKILPKMLMKSTLGGNAIKEMKTIQQFKSYSVFQKKTFILQDCLQPENANKSLK